METLKSSVLISKLITKEVENVYKKYSNIPDEEINIVASFIQKVEDNEIEFDPYLNYKTTKAIAETLRDEDNIDIVKLYIFLRFDVNIEKVKDAYESLESGVYADINGYYIYYKNMEQVMKELAKDNLEYKLEDTSKVASMFDEEELANMWVFRTSKEEVARQYLIDNDWWDVLEIQEPEEGYIDSNGNGIYYCYNGMEE